MNELNPCCDRNHRLVRWEPLSCDAGHAHREYQCPMRVGNRRCAEIVIVPPLSSVCTKKEN